MNLRQTLASSPSPPLDPQPLSSGQAENVKKASASLIHLSAPDAPLDRAYLDAPGGFVWWYLDLINDQGDGVVVIWSWGLPFLPGLAGRARRKRPMMPKFRPSFNLSVYKNHKLECYLLQEYTPQQAAWSACGDRWRFGDHVVRIEQTPEDLSLCIDVDAPLPGGVSRLTGTIKVHGLKRRPLTPTTPLTPATPTPPPLHDWSPRLAPCYGQVDLVDGESQERYVFEGRAYHDRNGGAKPLHELGFSHWIWGRAPFERCERIYYVLWPRGAAGSQASPTVLGLEIAADGTTTLHRDLRLVQSGRRKTLGGMVWHDSVQFWRDGEIWLNVKAKATLDSGPFYLRHVVHASCRHGAVTGIAESCDPDRVDLARHRPFVSMRVGSPQRPEDSMWRPLFTGPKAGRWRRFVRQFSPTLRPKP